MKVIGELPANCSFSSEQFSLKNCGFQFKTGATLEYVI